MAGNMLKDGLAWLTDQLIEHASEPITYARGYDSVETRATFGRKLLKLDDGQGGFRIEWTDMDFLIRADAAFTFGSGIITPQRGDIVWIAVATGLESFEVFPFGHNEPPWRWSDPHQSMYRIHTKHIDMGQFYT